MEAQKFLTMTKRIPYTLQIGKLVPKLNLKREVINTVINPWKCKRYLAG